VAGNPNAMNQCWFSAVSNTSGK